MNKVKTYKEYPILFQTDMVQAMLRNEKDVTRRIRGKELKYINESPDDWAIRGGQSFYKNKILDNIGWVFENQKTNEVIQLKSPYGKPGDLLYVRETWVKLVKEHFIHETDNYVKKLAFKADCDSECEEARQDYIAAGYPYKWKPSIHLPKELSRLWLENVDIRIERLHEITAYDAKMEGIEAVVTPGIPVTWKNYLGVTSYSNPVTSYKSLWGSINAKKDGGKYAYDRNPWVIRIEYKELSRTGKPALCKCGVIADSDGTCEDCFNTEIYERGC